jgi:hypothetical protein
VTHSRLKLVVISILLVTSGLVGCRTGGSDVKDLDYIRPLDQAPRSHPQNLTLVENLTWPSEDVIRTRENVRWEGDKIVGPEGEIKMKDYWDAYAGTFATWTSNLNLIAENCAQLVKNDAGARLVMVHAAPCPADGLLPPTSLRFYLTVDQMDSYEVKRGFDDFVSWPLFYRGYRVGSLHHSKLAGTMQHHLGELCQSRGAGDGQLRDDTATEVICSLTIMGNKLLRLSIKGNRSGSPTPLRLTGWRFSSIDNTGDIVPRGCIEETAPGTACTMHGDAMSDGCSRAGLELIRCRACERLCEAPFKP